MSVAENEAIIRRYLAEVVGAGNLDAIEAFMAADAVNHRAIPALPVRGTAALREHLRAIKAGLPDHGGVEDLIAAGDTVVARVTERGTHLGHFLGVPATGRAVAWTWLVIVRLAGGKIVERWGLVDRLGIRRQLDADPAAGQDRASARPTGPPAR